MRTYARGFVTWIYARGLYAYIAPLLCVYLFIVCTVCACIITGIRSNERTNVKIEQRKKRRKNTPSFFFFLSRHLKFVLKLFLRLNDNNKSEKWNEDLLGAYHSKWYFLVRNKRRSKLIEVSKTILHDRSVRVKDSSPITKGEPKLVPILCRSPKYIYPSILRSYISLLYALFSYIYIYTMYTRVSHPVSLHVYCKPFLSN